MNFSQTKRKLDKNLYKDKIYRFIPFACHYNESTILCKDGSLLSTLEIAGIEEYNNPSNIHKIRENIRNSILKRGNSNFAFWIQTVRRTTNIDDPQEYTYSLPSNIHRLWSAKNFLKEKYVNTIYITVIYKKPIIDTDKLKGYLNSLFNKKIENFHDKFLSKANNLIIKLTNEIINDLSDYKIKRLSTIIDDKENITYSEPLGLFYNLIHLKNEKMPLEDTDLSYSLSKYNFALGSSKIESIQDNYKRFASIFSIKSYQDVHNEVLDELLQVPVEMIISEVFYFIPKEQMQKEYKPHYKILDKTSSDEIKAAFSYDKIFHKNPSNNDFCSQQISIMCITSEINELDKKLYSVSKALSNLGLIHVKEDIMLEQIYWSQLPGNFKYLRRLYNNLSSQSAAFASLYNSPTGEKFTKWGRAISILRTNKGSPYFVNFHDDEGNCHTLITGKKEAGKTVLTNFLISEATKYNPLIFYFCNNNESIPFLDSIDVKNGFDGSLNPFNSKSKANKFKFFSNLLKDNNNEDKDIKNIISLLEKNPKINNIDDICNKLDFSKLESNSIKDKLDKYIEIECSQFLSNHSIDSKTINSSFFNLEEITDENFKLNNYPKQDKLLKIFNENAFYIKRFRISYILWILDEILLNIKSSLPKIFVFSDLRDFVDLEIFDVKLYQELFKKIKDINGALICSADTKYLAPHYENLDFKEFIELFSTNFIMPSSIDSKILTKLFRLDKNEAINLKLLNNAYRNFLIKQNETSILSELSLGGLDPIYRFLSCKNKDFITYQSIRSKYKNNDDGWIKEVFNEFIES